jgi:hypothetical protein
LLSKSYCVVIEAKIASWLFYQNTLHRKKIDLVRRHEHEVGRSPNHLPAHRLAIKEVFALESPLAFYFCGGIEEADERGTVSVPDIEVDVGNWFSGLGKE